MFALNAPVIRSVGVATWPRLLLGEDWASGEPKVCPLLEGVFGRDVNPPGSATLARGWARGEARSCPLSGPSLDLIALIRPSQLCADGGYQLRLGVLGVPLIMVPDRIKNEFSMNFTSSSNCFCVKKCIYYFIYSFK